MEFIAGYNPMKVTTQDTFFEISMSKLPWLVYYYSPLPWQHISPTDSTRSRGGRATRMSIATATIKPA